MSPVMCSMAVRIALPLPMFTGWAITLIRRVLGSQLMEDRQRVVLRAVVDADQLDLEIDRGSEDAANDGPQSARLVVDGHEDGERFHCSEAYRHSRWVLEPSPHPDSFWFKAGMPHSVLVPVTTIDRQSVRHLVLITVILVPLFALNGRWTDHANPDTVAVAAPAWQLANRGTLDLSEYDVIANNLEELGRWYVEGADGRIVEATALPG